MAKQEEFKLIKYTEIEGLKITEPETRFLKEKLLDSISTFDTAISTALSKIKGEKEKEIKKIINHPYFVPEYASPIKAYMESTEDLINYYYAKEQKMKDVLGRLFKKINELTQKPEAPEPEESEEEFLKAKEEASETFETYNTEEAEHGEE